MSAPLSLKSAIQQCELQHPHFIEQLGPLLRRIEGWLNGDTPSVEWLVGPSRVGKSMLLNSLARPFPETRENGRRVVRVLPVFLRPDLSPTQLPDEILRSLGVPLSMRGNAGAKFQRMADQLKRAGTQVMLVDEASHVVESGAKILPSAAGDWWKVVADERGLGISLVLMGVSRLEKLIKSNSQLRNRAAAKRTFYPYDYSVEDQCQAFRSCVGSYVEMFARAGYPIEIPFERFARHCYLVCAGLIGVLSKFLYQLAHDLSAHSVRPVTFGDCTLAASRIEPAGHPSCPGFVRDDVTLVEMKQAFVFAIDDAGMTVPRA